MVKKYRVIIDRSLTGVLTTIIKASRKYDFGYRYTGTDVYVWLCPCNYKILSKYFKLELVNDYI